MRVLVTGAAGFYGWAMVQRLVNREDVEKVIGLDNFSRKYFENVDAKQLGKNAQKFEVVRKDYSDLDTHVLNGMDLNAVIHFSAFISIDESMLIPFDYFNNNEVGTFKLTQALLKTKNQPALIFASSPEVYGNPHYTPIDELHPLHP